MFLYKFVQWSAVPVQNKELVYFSIDVIDYIAWHKQGTLEGSIIHSTNDKRLFIVEGLPENLNQVTFNGALFKATAQRMDDKNNLKKYSIWINPENIACAYKSMPDTTMIYFKSGENVILCNSLQNVISSLIDHAKKLRERRKLKYAKKST